MMSRAAAIGCVLSLTIAMAGCTPPPPKAPEASGYGAALEVVRDEGWLQREIRRFRTYPHLDRAYRMIVDLATAHGAAEEALAAADRLVALRPSADHRLRRGRVLQKLGRLKEAEVVFATALTEARDAAERLRVREARAELAEKQQHWGQARQELLAMLETDARNAAVLRRLAEVTSSGRDVGESTRWFRATAEASGSAQDRERLANALYAFGDYREAAREFSELVAT